MVERASILFIARAELATVAAHVVTLTSAWLVHTAARCLVAAVSIQTARSPAPAMRIILAQLALVLSTLAPQTLAPSVLFAAARGALTSATFWTIMV